MCSETSSTVDQVKKEYFINSEEFTIKFREWNESFNINSSLIRDQYNKLAKAHKQKTENMKNNLNELTDKLSSLINKMKLERSGFNSEFSNL